MSAATFRARMQSIAGRISLKLCMKFGVQITYVSRGTPISGLWCIPSGVQARMGEVAGALNQTAQREFIIPIQANFPPAAGLIGTDTIIDELGNNLSVKTWTNDNGRDDLQYEFKVVAEQNRAKRSGQAVT